VSRFLRGDSGQATAEYALVIVAAAVVALALIVWASTSGCFRVLRGGGGQGARRGRGCSHPVRGGRGSAVVEFALVLPLVLVVLLGAVEVAVVARTQLEVSQAAREGAREAAPARTRPPPWPRCAASWATGPGQRPWSRSPGTTWSEAGRR